MSKIKGVMYAVVSSSTFGLAPFFTLTLLAIGYTTFEVLTYRWGVASLCLIVCGLLSKCNFHLGRKDFYVVFLLSLFRASTSLSLVIAYQNIPSGVASTIHFMYPLAVALSMMFFFHEKKSGWILSAVFISIIGAILLSYGNIHAGNGNTTTGIIAACISVFSYGAYIIGIRKSRAVQIDSTALTCYVMVLGTLIFAIFGYLKGGIRLETNIQIWPYILGLALPATAISNIALVKAIKYIGPTQTSIFGAMEPLTAVVIGVFAFHELFSLKGALGILLIIIAVSIAVLHQKKITRTER